MILNYMEKKRTGEPGMARFLSALRPACCTDTSPSATCCSNRSRIWGTTPNSNIFTQLLSKSKKRGNLSYKSDILEKVGVIQTKLSLKKNYIHLLTISGKVSNGQSSWQLQLSVWWLQPGENILIHHPCPFPETLLHWFICNGRQMLEKAYIK